MVEHLPRYIEALRGCGFQYHCSHGKLSCHRRALTRLEAESNLEPYMAALPSGHSNVSVRKRMRQTYTLKFRKRNELASLVLRVENEGKWKQRLRIHADNSCLPALLRR